MATKTVTYRADDLDGTQESETTPVSLVHFALDGTSYEIDLTATNSQALHDVLADYVAHARKVTSRRSSTASGTPRATSTAARVDREQNQAIRDWARSHGYQVNDRGRIPAAVSDAYNLGGEAANAKLAELIAERQSKIAAHLPQGMATNGAAPQLAEVSG